jgi:hypothetical protein
VRLTLGVAEPLGEEPTSPNECEVEPAANFDCPPVLCIREMHFCLIKTTVLLGQFVIAAEPLSY